MSSILIIHWKFQGARRFPAPCWESRAGKNSLPEKVELSIADACIMATWNSSHTHNRGRHIAHTYHLPYLLISLPHPSVTSHVRGNPENAVWSKHTDPQWAINIFGLVTVFTMGLATITNQFLSIDRNRAANCGRVKKIPLRNPENAQL